MAVLLIAWSFHWMRMRQIAREFSAHREGRLDERLRVARELHDTLLQSFQGVLMMFQAVTYMLPDRPAQAREKLEAVIERARQAVTEGRNAVQGLRSSAVATTDLAQAIRTLAEELTRDRSGGDFPEFRMQVEGPARDLAPLVRDNLHRLGHEAVRNAFCHAQARRIEVEIQYERRGFRLRVRDDGKGIEPTVLAEGGRAGHHGLPGMQERADLVGGKLAVRSRAGSGTEIELTIPASIAYTKSPPARRSMSSGKGAG
jgi:signal transduction histidine kinase